MDKSTPPSLVEPSHRPWRDSWCTMHYMDGCRTPWNQLRHRLRAKGWWHGPYDGTAFLMGCTVGYAVIDHVLTAWLMMSRLIRMVPWTVLTIQQERHLSMSLRTSAQYMTAKLAHRQTVYSTLIFAGRSPTAQAVSCKHARHH